MKLLSAACIILVVLVLLSRLLHPGDIEIGFAGQLTGKQMELGTQERDGILLALDDINAKGGIQGRRLKLLVRDDFGDPGKARQVDHELIASGVVAIIGHPTTAQSLAGLQVTEPAKLVMFSPTVSSPTLSGKDDYFLRIYPSFEQSSRAFADYIFQRAKVMRLAIILDADNAAFTQTYQHNVVQRFQSLGGTIVKVERFSSQKQPDMIELLRNLQAMHPDGLLILASDVDTSLIAQRVRSQYWQIPLFTSAWAQTATLLNNGGQAIEGLRLEQSFSLDNHTPALDDFQKRFDARYGRAPSFGAAFGYEAALIMAEALKKTGGGREGLKEALLATRNFPGLVDRISLDKYGDVDRPFYLSEVRQGKFVLLEKLSGPH